MKRVFSLMWLILMIPTFVSATPNCPDEMEKDKFWYVDYGYNYRGLITYGIYSVDNNGINKTYNVNGRDMYGDIAVAPDGYIYVASMHSNEIIKFSKDGTTKIKSLGELSNIGRSPNGLAFDENGYLYVGYSRGAYYRVKDINSNTSHTLWFNPRDIFSGSNVGSSGDVIFANGKGYVSINDNNWQDYLIELQLGDDNNIISHKIVGKLPSRSYGLSTDGFGKLFVASDKTIFELDLSNESDFGSSYIIPITIKTTVRTKLAGLSSKNESLGNVCIEPEIIADYHFDACSWDGTAGEVKDSSGNGFDGRTYSLTNSDDNAILNRSAKFVSADDTSPYRGSSIQVRNISGAEPNNFSSIFWLKIKDDDTRKSHALIKFRGFKLCYDDNGSSLTLKATDKDDPTHYLYKTISNGISLNDGQWHNIALVVDQGVVKIYIDKDLKYDANNDSNSISYNNIKTNDYLAIAYTSPHAKTIYMDELKIYKGALTAQMIQKIYDNEKSGKNSDGSDRETIECNYPHFECKSNSFLIKSDGKDALNSTMMRFNLITGKKDETIEGIGDYNINAIGFNPVDGYIYGWQSEDSAADYNSSKDDYHRPNAHLVFIDSDYKVHNVGLSSDIPDSKVRFFVGDVSTDGIMYLANMLGSDADMSQSKYQIVNNENDIDINQSKIGGYFLGKIRVVDLNTKSPKGTIQIKYIGDQLPIRAADFAISPIDGQLYTINATNNKLVRIIVHSDDSSKIGTVQELGTVYPLIDGKLKLKRIGNYNQTYSKYTYFDKFGNLYFQVDENDNNLKGTYKVDTTYWLNASAGENDTIAMAHLFSKLKFSISGDGARCSLAPVGDHPVVKIFDASGVEGNSVDFKVSSDRNITEPTTMECDLSFVSKGAVVSDFENDKTHYSFDLKNIALDEDKKFTISIPTVDDRTPEHSEKFKISCHSDDLIFVNEEDKNASGMIIDNDVNSIDAFDSWDVTKKKGVLRTKVVNRSFGFVIHQIDSAGDLSISGISGTSGTKEDMNNTKYRVIDAKDCENNASKVNFNDSSFKEIVFDNEGKFIVGNENISKGIKEAKVQLIWIDKDGKPRITCSSDSFAIRPDHFSIDLNTSGAIKAGNFFKITIKADDNISGLVSEYNATQGVNFDIDTNETHSNCHFDRDFKFDGVPMKGGKFDESRVYNEVGKIYLTIREKDGEEFAKVDSNDTSVDARLITPASKTISFVPDHFEVNSSIKGVWKQSRGYTIISNHPSSSPIWEINVTAVNKDGNPTINYGKQECGLQNDVSITPLVEYDKSRDDLNLTVDDNSTKSEFGSFKESFVIKGDKFNNATAKKELTYNFKRSKFVALKPVDVKFKSVVAKDTTINNLSGTDGLNKSITYKYMRTYVQSPIESVGKKDIDVKVFYEAYDPDHFGKISKSGDRAWKIVEQDSNIPTMNFGLDYGMSRGVQKKVTNVITNINLISINQDDNETISLTAHKLPSNAKVVFTRDDDFKYVTDTISSNIFFNPNSANWAGKGKQGRTIDNTTSAQRKFKRIDW